MTQEVLKYCGRGIVQYLDGDVDKFRCFVNKAMAIYRDTLCKCGNVRVRCRYGGTPAKLCTSCGRIWRDGNVIYKCLVRGKTA